MMMYLAIDQRFVLEDLGYLPEMLSEDDPRSAKEQLDAGYQHGGGWRPMSGWKRNGDGPSASIQYPGDPPLKPLAATFLHGKEAIVFYPHGFVLILQRNNSFEVARMD
jgi:hypothetical protein